MRKISVFVLVLVMLNILAACQSSPTATPEQVLQPTSSPTSTREQGSVATSTLTPSSEVSGTDVPAGEEAGSTAACTVVTRRGEPTPVSPFQPVDGQDHVLGPEDAKVTFIEYSDFQ